MASNRKTNPKNPAAPTKPGTPAEASAKEAGQTASLATPPAETGATSEGESKATVPQGGDPAITDPAPAPKIQPKAKREPVVTHIIVTAEKEGFRRAGRAWSKVPTQVPVDEFNEAQIEALVGEPMLDVAFVAE